MSVVNFELEQITPTTIIVTWAGLHNGDTGQPLPITGYAERGQAATGTPGSGIQINIETSSSGLNPYFTDQHSISTVPSRSDAASDDIAFSLVRPNVVSGDGSTNVTVTLVLVAPVIITT